MAVNLNNRSFLKLLDFSSQEIEYLLNLSAELKKSKKEGKEEKKLADKNIALIFEKTSTRTRCAFEVAAHDQGASTTYLGPTGTQIGSKESMKDTARVLGRMYDGIEYRGYGQSIVEELAEFSGVPVWNGLTNEFHPTQVLADLLTMREHCHKPLHEISFAYVGDARNNMGNSLLVGAVKLGMDFRAAAPNDLLPEKQLVNTCKNLAQQSGASVLLTENIEEAVKNADFIYTDVWVSMGEEESIWENRIKQLMPYQVNLKMLELTKNPDVKFLHCLPAFHNRETVMGEMIFQKTGIQAMEVTEEIFESPASVVFDEAENRVHTIKSVMVATLGGR